MYSPDIFLDQILQYGEVRMLFGVLAIAATLVFVFLIIVLILHSLSQPGKTSLLYRSRPPAEHWSRTFYPALFLVLLAVTLVAWTLMRWSMGEVSIL